MMRRLRLWLAKRAAYCAATAPDDKLVWCSRNPDHQGKHMTIIHNEPKFWE